MDTKNINTRRIRFAVPFCEPDTVTCNNCQTEIENYITNTIKQSIFILKRNEDGTMSFTYRLCMKCAENNMPHEILETFKYKVPFKVR